MCPHAGCEPWLSALGWWGLEALIKPGVNPCFYFTTREEMRDKFRKCPVKIVTGQLYPQDELVISKSEAKPWPTAAEETDRLASQRRRKARDILQALGSS